MSRRTCGLCVCFLCKCQQMKMNMTDERNANSNIDSELLTVQNIRLVGDMAFDNWV